MTLPSRSDAYGSWAESGRAPLGPAATMALGAAAGLVLAFLYLTDDGRRLRARIDPFLEGAMDEMKRLRGTAEKARQAWREGQESLSAFGNAGSRPTA
jgi:hypothetical protein